MGYQRRKGPIDYKSYGHKKKTRRKTRVSKTGILFILLGVALLFWMLASCEKEEEDVVLPGLATSRQRKNIYDRGLAPLAVTFDLYAVYIKPLEVKDSVQTGETLASILELDRDELVKKLRAERSFVWLGHQVPYDKVAELAKLQIAGLYFQKAPVRYYPHEKTSAQVLGYVKDEQGLAGIELFYDKELRGKDFSKMGGGSTAHPFDNGKHIVLTLDLKTQTILEKQMALLLDKTQARSVAAMAVDPVTGEIVASAQLPSFDPNSFWDATPQSQKMEMVSTAMNTGGISALFRYGAAIHAGKDISTRQADAQPVSVIRPRLQKSGGQARAGYWWSWPGGGFISDELAELPDPTVDEKEVRAFQQDLGISCADQVDMPNQGQDILVSDKCGEGRLNGISVLGAFSRLVNGGKPVTLHFLKGTIGPAGNYESYTFKTKGQDVAKVSAVLEESFAASAGDNARFFAAEYLFPLEKSDVFVVESQQGDQTSEVFKSCQTFNGMFVASSPVDNPKLVLLILVMDGEFDLRAASPMRRVGDAFLREAVKVMADRGTEDLASVSLPGEMPLLAEWFAHHEKKSVVEEVAEARVGKIPNVLGLSLRKALLDLMPCKVAIEIDGAGSVVAQEPEPGQECGEKIRLRLAGGPEGQQ